MKNDWLMSALRVSDAGVRLRGYREAGDRQNAPPALEEYRACLRELLRAVGAELESLPPEPPEEVP